MIYLLTATSNTSLKRLASREPTNSLTKITTTAANEADLAFLNNAGGAPLVVSPVEGTAAAMAYEVLDHGDLVAALRAVLREA